MFTTHPPGDHRLSYSSLWASNQQRALERKRLSEGNILSRASLRSDLALPIPVAHTRSSVPPPDTMVGGGPFIGTLIQRGSAPSCLSPANGDIPSSGHMALHHLTPCGPAPVALKSLLRRNRSASMRSSVTFMDAPPLKGEQNS